MTLILYFTSVSSSSKSTETCTIHTVAYFFASLPDTT